GRAARRATPDDAPALTAFYNSSPLFGGRFVEGMRESLQRVILWYVPATDMEGREGLAPGGIAASAWASTNLPGAARLAGICTPPSLTGRGLASLATSAVCAEVLGRGLVPCLWVSHDNPAAMKVYDRLGFRPVEEVTKLRYVEGQAY
ncbi:MAG: GNAT family N-acetyltransferase, partial [Bacillota bacterium]